MGRASFLHISDLHISKFPNLKTCSKRTIEEWAEGVSNHAYCASYDPGRLKGIVQLAHDVRERIDAIVITGDIATTGLTRDLTPSYNFIYGSPDEKDIRTSKGFPTLAGTGLSVLALPGNHDRYKKLLKKFGYIPGGKHFDRIFAEHWNDEKKLLPIVKDDLAVGVIGADFNLLCWQDSDAIKSPVGFYAQGRVYDKVLAELEGKTDEFVKEHLYDREIVLVWAVHFPPDASVEIDPSSELIGSENLLASADKNKVFLMVSGHLHNPFQLSSPSTKVVPDLWNFDIFGAGTASQFNSENHCQIITLDNSEEDLGVGLEHFWFSEIDDAFIPEEDYLEIKGES